MRPDRIAHLPFLKIFIASVSGILLRFFCEIDLFYVIPLLVLCAAAAVISKKSRLRSVAILASVALVFFCITSLRTYKNRMPLGEYLSVALEVDSDPVLRGKWYRCDASVFYFASDSGAWIEAEEKILLSVDSTLRPSRHQRMVVKGWVNPIDTVGTSYGKLMARRGFYGRMFISAHNIVEDLGADESKRESAASFLHRASVAKLGQLALGTDQMAVVKAMVSGERSEISAEMRRDYNETGAAHLLAVSGLHVGIVFILVNLLFSFVVVFPRGNIAKNALAIVAIWVYAMSTGLSASVVRASVMFTFLQLSLATNSSRDSLNILLGSAVLMLAYNPYYLAEPGFVLSYSAVLFILLLYQPLFDVVKTRYKIVNALISVVIIGVAANIGTAPLVAYWFGNFSIAGIVINPVVILTAHIIVMVSVIWLLIPLPFLNTIFSFVLSCAATLQNRIVAWSANLHLSATGLEPPLIAILITYAALLGLSLWVNNSFTKRKSLNRLRIKV